MNFTSVFEELSKLYEENVPEVEKEEAVEEPIKEELTEATNDASSNVSATSADQDAADTNVAVKGPSDNKVANKHAGAFDIGEVDPNSGINRMVEAADEEETPVEDEEIEIVDDEPRQVILECDKCGAIMIKSEADIVVDEESDLANVEDECQFCEETAGYKIIGVVAPYETTDEAIEEPVSDVVEDDTTDEEILAD